MNRIKIEAIFFDDDVRVTGAPTDQIRDAIKDMALEYDNLTFEGYMDGHHFCIEKVTNNVVQTECPDEEVLGMYYHAFCPECITFEKTW